MADTNEKYLDLITSQYADKPKFNAYVKAFLDMISPAIDCLTSFDTIFNLENAVGDQLDKCGALVALTRELPLSNPDIPSILSDDLFRTVIKARIYSNFWDGTLQSWNDIIKTMFPDASYEVVDNQDMSIDVIMIDPTADATMLALLFNGYIVPKPSGVRVTWTIQDKALFGWETETEFIAGWDTGIWADN